MDQHIEASPLPASFGCSQNSAHLDQLALLKTSSIVFSVHKHIDHVRGVPAAFCKGHGEKGCGAGGFVCKGHFVGAKVLPQSESPNVFLVAALLIFSAAHC